MASYGYPSSVTCSMQRPQFTAPLDHIRSSLYSTFKPVMTELQQLHLRFNVLKPTKTTSTGLTDAIVDSFFRFIEQPMMVQGNFAPVKEIGEAVAVPAIEGNVPENFPEGVYLRNGANPLFPDKMATISMLGKSSFIWVEGDGMLHATYFNKEKHRGNWVVSYKNRYIETPTFMMEKERSKALFLPATEGQPQAILVAFLLNLLRFGKINKDTSNTNVFEHAGKVYTIMENHLPYEVNISNLDTLNVWELGSAWDHRPFTSHPKRDPRSGEMVTMGIDAKKPFYVVGIISANGKELVHKVDLKFERCTLSHDIGITEKYNIIMDYPLIIDIGRVVRGGSLIKYEKDRGARIGVMPRYGDAESLMWFDVKTHCTFHIINSYEDGDEVVVMGCRATGSIIPGPNHGVGKQDWFRRAFRPVASVTEGFDSTIDGILFSRPYEWRLNIKTGAVKEGYLTEPGYAMDFPTINSHKTGLKNRYAYTQVVDSVESSRRGMAVYKMLGKLYLEEHEDSLGKESEGWIKVEYHELEKEEFCSGLQFVQNPEGSDEDDGWLLCYVHNEKTNVSQVHIIDAKEFGGEAVVKITLPQRVPYGFHSSFICQNE